MINQKSSVVSVLAAIAIVAIPIFVSSASGHFIWVAKSPETGKVNIFFGEGPFADQAEFLDGIKGMQVWSLDNTGQPVAVGFERKTADDNGWFECLAENAVTQIDVDCEYGLFSRGGNSMFLHYSAKYVDNFGSGHASAGASGKLPLDIAVQWKSGKANLLVTFKSKPARDCEVQIVDDKGATQDLKTDAAGRVVFKYEPVGRWLIRAKVTDSTPGSHEGKDYSEKRYYCTLVTGMPENPVVANNGTDMEKTETAGKNDMSKSPFPELPIGITSFGGAVAGDKLYVFGGHCGDAHDYYKEGQNAKLYRLNLKQPRAWEVVNESSGLQGLAMVEYKGDLFRVGGFAAHNAEGEKQDLSSVAEFARFDFEANQWKQLKPMPTPRSSLDAVVVGDTLYVVGGWMMRGGEKTAWCDDAVSIDLSQSDAEWKKIEVPFKRRAMSVGWQGDHLYVVGGMLEKGGTTSDVEVYNIAEKTWGHGPKLPGEGSMEGFGSSCFNIGGTLVVSTYGGNVLRLDNKGDQWHKIEQLPVGRFFHRLLPLSDDKFVIVGGANMDSGKTNDLQVYSINQ